MNFLADYHLFTKGNEASPNYHLWSGLAALSSIISRRVWIEQGYFRVYPNLYIILIGPPGNKKTTAMSIAKGLIRELSPQGEIPFSAECQTKESIVKELPELQRTFQSHDPATKPLIYTPYAIFITELSQFLGANSLHMIDFLTTIWDQEVYDCKTKNKGSELVIGPYLTMLACTTPDWITSYLKTDVITGGFSRRCIFVLEHDDGDPVPFPEITAEMAAARDRLIAHSKTLFEVSGEFAWTTDAKAFYSEWYCAHKKGIKDNPPDATIRGYLGSKHVQLLKISMLISLAQSTTLLMERPTLEVGLAILDGIEGKLVRVFQGMGRNELNALSNQVLDLLQMSGPLPEKKVQAMMWQHANGQELFQILQHLEKTEKIQRYEKVQGDSKRIWIKLPTQAMA